LERVGVSSGGRPVEEMPVCTCRFVSIVVGVDSIPFRTLRVN